jgi:TonB family protein
MGTTLRSLLALALLLSQPISPFAPGQDIGHPDQGKPKSAPPKTVPPKPPPPKPSLGALIVKTEPPDAEVLVKSAKGATVPTIKSEAGVYKAEKLTVGAEYSVEVSAINFEPQRIPVLIKAGQPNLVTATLDREKTQIVYWDGIKNETNAELFFSYIQDYPKGEYVRLAVVKLKQFEQQQWKSIEASNKPRDFATYIKIYDSAEFRKFNGKGQFVEDAEKSLQGLEEKYWKSIADSSDADDLNHYIEWYPKGRFRADANQKLRALATAQPSAPSPATGTVVAVKPASDPDADLWQAVSAKGTAEDLKSYLTKYPNGKHGDEAKNRLDSIAEAAKWEQAQKDGSQKGYVDYLNQYGAGGLHAPRAKERLAELQEATDWNRAIGVADLSAFKQYVNNHKDGKHSPEANKRIAELEEDAAWSVATKSMDPADFEKYLKMYPNGRYDGGTALEEAVWKQTEDSKEPAAFDRFVRRFPSGKHADQARALQTELNEQNFWNSIYKSGDPADFKKYVSIYPNGAHFDEATARLAGIEEASAWKFAEQSKTLEAYGKYLAEYPAPNGKHAGEAQKRLNELRDDSDWQAIKDSENPKAFDQYLKDHQNGRHESDAKAKRQAYMARMNDQADQALWLSVMNSQKPEDIDRYLKQYPGGKFAAQAAAKYEELTDDADWSLIVGSDTLAPFQGYLNRHSNGHHAGEARAQVADFEDWASASRLGSTDALKAYLSKHQNGRFSREASARIADANSRLARETETKDWRGIESSNNQIDIQNFLNKYPNGEFSGAAKSRLSALAVAAEESEWDSIKGKADPRAFKDFLGRYPRGRHESDAETRISELKEARDWNSIKDSADPESFNKFLGQYPSGKYASAAKDLYEKRKDQALWNSVARSANPADLRRYLDQFPNGLSADAARGRLNELLSKASSSANRLNPTASAAGADERGISVAELGVGAKLDLRTLDFSTVIYGPAPGFEPETSNLQARYFPEDLGGAVTMEMVAVPGGGFNMGSSEDPKERPAHKVTVRAFFMGKTEVTIAQWKAVAGMSKVDIDLNPDPAYFKEDDQLPVGNVNWPEAVEFCKRLSKHTGRTYRLPTEAEWEYACRAGTTTAFSFGDAITTSVANFDGRQPYRKGPPGERRGHPVKVGSLGQANRFGLYDMHGNALEWCSDVWHESYDQELDGQAPNDGSSWNAGGQPALRVLRGGGWTTPARLVRSSARLGGGKDDHSFNWGLRVVLALSAPTADAGTPGSGGQTASGAAATNISEAGPVRSAENPQQTALQNPHSTTQAREEKKVFELAIEAADHAETARPKAPSPSPSGAAQADGRDKAGQPTQAPSAASVSAPGKEPGPDESSQQAQPPEAAKETEPGRSPGHDQTTLQEKPKGAGLRVTEQALWANASKKVAPLYPSEARRRRREGQVVVEVVISAKGRVISAHAVRGDPMLLVAAMEAAREWEFSPNLVPANQDSVTGELTFTFDLHN